MHKQGFKISLEEKKLAWAVMRARTMVVADHHFDRLAEINEEFATWLCPLVKLCAVVYMLAKGVSRRSLLTSNPNEQLHSVILPERAEPLCDLIGSLMQYMATKCFLRHRKAQAISIHVSNIYISNVYVFNVYVCNIYVPHIYISNRSGLQLALCWYPGPKRTTRLCLQKQRSVRFGYCMKSRAT